MKHKLCISTQFDMLEVFAEVVGSNKCLDQILKFKREYWYIEVALQRRSFIGVLKTCSKFTREHPCRNVISIKLQSKATLRKPHLGMGVLLEI